VPNRYRKRDLTHPAPPDAGQLRLILGGSPVFRGAVHNLYVDETGNVPGGFCALDAGGSLR
jgi:hypothetical protein